MISNNLKLGIKKLKKKDKHGTQHIIESIRIIYNKCIKLGRKRKWIIPVRFGASMVADAGTRILTSIKNIVSGRSSKNV